MKIMKRVICFVLCVAITVSCTALCTSAASEEKNKYPFVFVHGLNGWGEGEGINSIVPYWGATSCDLMEYLGEEGYECYSASVGPFSSAWDRACELYAQLAGTTVDYGEAHSKEHNHLRYGRTYDEPLVENWGSLDKNGKIQKVHLIGHSFGGTTARLLVELLTNGNEAERKATPKGEISELFTGGKGDWVESVTTICTPHNSSTSYYIALVLGVLEILPVFSAIYASTLGRGPLNGTYVDFHLEQFGMTNIPGQDNAGGYFRSIANYLKNSDDSAQYDLTPEGAQAVNDMISINKDVYYISYAFSTTKELELTGINVPYITTNPIIAPVALIAGNTPEFTDFYTGQLYDSSWHSNDALVNTVSALYPFDEPHREYDGRFEKGVWNVMPVQRGDHGQAIGLLTDRKETKAFYLELAGMLCGLEK